MRPCCMSLSTHCSPLSASLSSSSYLRPKPVHLLGLSTFVLVALNVAFFASTPSRRYPSSQNKIEFTLRQTKDFRRLLGGPQTDQDQHQHFSRQFRIRSGYFPESHPSQPYHVKIDETGSFVDTVEYGHKDHPLSRLADVREPRDAERESVFFFLVPKVIIISNSSRPFFRWSF